MIGKANGYTKKKGDIVLIIPEVDKNLITPHTEAFQSVIWHCLVSHPYIQSNKTKW